MVTQEAEAHEAAACEVHTDDVTQLFRVHPGICLHLFGPHLIFSVSKQES